MVNYNFKPKKTRDDFGWHTRKLPHLDGEAFEQFITFRLADSLPQGLLELWRNEAVSDADFRRRIERYLDEGLGECLLLLHQLAALVRDALKFHDGKKYVLIAWVIMPNHVHALLRPLAGHHLPDILHSIKSFTAQQANKILGRKGQFWQHESFDRYIRNVRHRAAVIRYIENNPVKAGLSSTPEEWVFGSAHERSTNASRSDKQDACRSSHD